MQQSALASSAETLTARVIELANRGCRIQTDPVAMQCHRIRMAVPTATPERVAEVSGRIVGRSAPSHPDEPCTLAVIFDADLADDARREITNWINGSAHVDEEVEARPPLPHLPPRLSPEDPTLTLDDETDPAVCACIELECELDGDRREHERHAFAQSVLAQGEPRVRRILLGRDLSVGGIRIDRDPRLVVGADLHLAIHDPERTQPLELEARVLRDDGDEGWALSFSNVGSELAAGLEKLVAKLPDTASLAGLYEPELGDEMPEGLACEILDR